jgi:hypothetical protein
MANVHKELFRNRKIALDCIFYVEGGKAYLQENAHIISSALDYWNLPAGSVVFSDEGNAFWRDGDGVISNKQLTHVMLSPPLHHIQSACDNSFNRDAKAYARAQNVKFNDHALWVAELLAGCDRIKSDVICGYFKSNFLLGEERVSTAAIKKLVRPEGKNAMTNAKFYQRCQKAFEDAGGAAWLQEPDDVPVELQDFNESGTRWN